ncbi:MAG: hypothetical protein U0136_13645 [Bdellovibrionota bacterium]
MNHFVCAALKKHRFSGAPFSGGDTIAHYDGLIKAKLKKII